MLRYLEETVQKIKNFISVYLDKIEKFSRVCSNLKMLSIYCVIFISDSSSTVRFQIKPRNKFLNRGYTNRIWLTLKTLAKNFFLIFLGSSCEFYHVQSFRRILANVRDPHLFFNLYSMFFSSKLFPKFRSSI